MLLFMKVVKVKMRSCLRGVFYICLLGDIMHNNIHSSKMSKNDPASQPFQEDLYHIGVKGCKTMVQKGSGGRR